MDGPAKPSSGNQTWARGEERGQKVFQNSTTGPGARMNLKGEGRGHRDGNKGKGRRLSPSNLIIAATIHWGCAGHPETAH